MPEYTTTDSGLFPFLSNFPKKYNFIKSLYMNSIYFLVNAHRIIAEE
jgi:hypothetical protein